jgi:hypothetical protein
MDITELLERAVADVTPDERRPTDAVLRLAESRRLGSRLRKALAGLVGLVVIGGGVAVVATGGQDDDRDRQTTPPRPLTLQVDLPDGWRTDASGLALDCESTLSARTLYRDALIGDVGSCGETGPDVSGPTMLVGRLDPELAELVRATGVVVPAAGTAGYVVGFDAVSSFGVFLPVGRHDDLAYAVLAPHSPADEPAYGEPYNVVPVPSLPPELVDLMATARATGDLADDLVLPKTVSAVDLRTESLNVGAAPAARVSTAGGVADVLAELAAAPDGTGPCAAPVSARTFWVEDERTARWSRLDVLADDAGCRTAVSELGGSRIVDGDPAAAATMAESPVQVSLGPAPRTVTAYGLSIAVPEDWGIVRGTAVDPCALTGPTVVVADELTPSCYASFGGRPTAPYAWVTGTRIEKDGYVDDPLRGEDGRLPLDWSKRMVDVRPGLLLEGILGLPEEGNGRVLVVGLDQQESLSLRQSVEPR